MNKLLMLVGGGTVIPVEGDDFFAANGCTVPFSNAHDASAAHFADTNTTWFAWEASTPPGLGGLRHARVRTFNHTTGIWSPEYVAGLFGLTDDNHGQPVICRDDAGYVHMFYGSHAAFIRCASTHNPNDPSVWRENATIAGSWSYYHPYVIGGVIHLFTRDATVSTRRALKLVKTTSITAGVPTWGSPISVIDHDPDSRVYKGAGFVDGLNIHFVACRANGDATTRKNVYYYVYETDTGDVRNFDDNVTIDALDLPVSFAESEASFRVFSNPSFNITNIPASCLDDNGHPHVLCSDGLLGAQLLKHVWHNGTAWQAAANVGGTMTFEIDGLGIHPMAGGGVAALWPEDEESIWVRGGNMRRNTWEGGVWGTPTTILEADDWPFNGGMKVRDGIAGARAFFSEHQINETDEVGALKIYAVQEDGSMLKAPAFVHIPTNAETTILCDRFTTPPTMQRLADYDAMLSKLKDIGLELFDAYYILAGADSQCITQNLIGNIYNLTPNGGLTHTADRGVTGNGTTGYYTTGFIPSTAGGAMTTNSAHVAAHTHLTNDNDAAIISVDAGAVPGLFLTPYNSLNQVQFRINGSTTTQVANVSASGYYCLNRSASNACQVDRNGAQITTNTQASVGLPTSQIKLFGNGSTVFSDNRVSIFHFGVNLGSAVSGNRTKCSHAERFWNLTVGALP